jgi:long-subunit acyl-CoA synthetase (AMP-forming)
VSKSSAKKAIFDVVMKYNLHELHSGVLHNPSWIDQLIFKEIRDGMGGRLKLMITGKSIYASIFTV